MPEAVPAPRTLHRRPLASPTGRDCALVRDPVGSQRMGPVSTELSLTLLESPTPFSILGKREENMEWGFGPGFKFSSVGYQ